VAKTIDLELTRAEVEVLELEARLRVVPMNDTQLSDALKTALAAPPSISPGGRSAIRLTLGPADQAAVTKQVTDAEAELASLQNREDVLKQRIARLSSRLSALGAEEWETSKVLRRVETHRSLYATLSEKLGTARVQEQGEDRGLRVIDRATLPLGPNNAPAKKIILLGILLGLGLGVGVAGVIEYFNQPIETEDDVFDATGLPVLGWLPTIAGHQPTTGVEREPLNLVNGEQPGSTFDEAHGVRRRDGTHIRFNTAKGRVKDQNLRRNPTVAQV